MRFVAGRVRLRGESARPRLPSNHVFVVDVSVVLVSVPVAVDKVIVDWRSLHVFLDAMDGACVSQRAVGPCFCSIGTICPGNPLCART